MNILIFAGDDIKYGTSRALLQMAINLVKKPDINLTIVVNSDSNMADALKEHGCKVVVIHYSDFIQPYPAIVWWWFPIRFIYQGIKYWYWRIFALKDLEKKIKIEDIDLIHSNSRREDLGATLSAKYKIPLIWHIRELGDGAFRCFSFRKDYIQLMNNTASCFIAVSDAVKNHWINKGLNELKFIRVYDGVQLRNNIQNRKVDLKSKREIKLVMTGSLLPPKGQEQAIKMMAELKADGLSCTLDLIGDGYWTYTIKLKKTIKDLKLEKSVRLLGYRNNVHEILPNYDIGLMCSKDEAFGLVTAEYLMAGLPVLASDSGANRELVREGIDGYLYDYGNIQDMKEKLLKIIDENLGGMQSHRYAKRKFSDVANAENIYNIYISILKGKSESSEVL